MFVNLADNLDEAIAAFIAYSKSKALSPQTITYFESRLRAFRKKCDLPPREITPAAIREILATASSPATANHIRSVLRNFFNFLINDGYLETNPVKKVAKQKAPKPVIETFTGEQIHALLKACENDFCGIRDKAIFLTLLDTGMRANELMSLSVSDIDWTNQTLHIREGKGGKGRIVPFGASVAGLSEVPSASW